MLRRFRTVVAATFVLFAGAQAASAATIGAFALVDTPFGPTLEVVNFFDSGLEFADLSAALCDGSVVPAPPGGYLSATGASQGCDGTSTTARFVPDVLEAGDSTFFLDLDPLPSSGFAFLSMTMRDVSSPTGPTLSFYVDPIDLSCDPTSTDCSTFIYSAPVPEPVSLLLLAGGLGTMAARRARRRA